MSDMARKQIVPAAMEYTAAVTQLAVGKQNLNLPAELERKTITQLSEATEQVALATDKLEEVTEQHTKKETQQKEAEYFRDTVIPAMNALRQATDKLETEVGEKYWPFPVYSDLLFRV